MSFNQHHTARSKIPNRQGGARTPLFGGNKGGVQTPSKKRSKPDEDEVPGVVSHDGYIDFGSVVSGMSGLSANASRFEDYQHKEFPKLTEMAAPLAKNLSTMPNVYSTKLKDAMNNSMTRGALSVMCTDLYQGGATLELVENAIAEEERAYAYSLVNAQRNTNANLIKVSAAKATLTGAQAALTDAEAELAEAQAEYDELSRKKTVTVGKARAMVAVARVAMNNIRQAIHLDTEDLEESARKKKEWDALIVQQNRMQHGEPESIELILKDMKTLKM